PLSRAFLSPPRAPPDLHSFPTRRSSDLDPRYQEATEPLRCLGQGEEEIAHRRRGEPLVPGDAVKAFTGGYRTRGVGAHVRTALLDRKSTRLNSSHVSISYAVFCLKKKSI